MPALPHPCPECATITRTGTRCAPCTRDYERDRSRQRGARPWYGNTYKQARTQALNDHPYCAARSDTDPCDGPLETDHVTPRSLNNGLQVLCKHHHQQKTTRDRANHAQRDF